MNILKEYTVKLTKFNLYSPLSLICLLACLSTNTYARFLVEPQYRIYTGDYKGNGSKGDLKGEGAILNLGYIGDYFMAGISAEKGYLSFDGDITGNGASNFTYGGFGTFLGFHFFNRFKLYTGYMNTSIEPSNDGSYRYFGQQINFGLGYRIWDFVILNYEYMTNVYTQIEDDNTGKTSGLSSNIRSNKQSLGLSFIFIF